MRSESERERGERRERERREENGEREREREREVGLRWGGERGAKAGVDDRYKERGAEK